jgi:hypothetical protein
MLAVNGTTWLNMYSAYRRNSTGERAVTPAKRSASPRVASATDTFLYATLVLGCLRLTWPQEHFGILHSVVSPASYGWLLSAVTFFFLAERATTAANFGKLSPVASSPGVAAKTSGRSRSPSQKPRSRSTNKHAKGGVKDA